MLRHSLKTAAGFAIVILLAACSPKQPEMQAAKDAERKESPRTKTVIDDQLKALDKAKAVQATLDKQKADADKAIEDAGG